MDNVIFINAARFGNRLIDTVDARELHRVLEVKSRFNDWIVRRIEDYGFLEEKDLRTFLSESSGGRPSKEYALSIGMGKELAMVERTAKGREIRRYFIEVEQAMREGRPESRVEHEVSEASLQLALKTVVSMAEVFQKTVIPLEERLSNLEHREPESHEPADILQLGVPAALGGATFHSWFLASLRARGATVHGFSRQHGWSSSTVSEAVRGVSNGPRSRSIRKKIRKILAA